MDLIAFDRIHLLPGETRTLVFAVPAELLAVAQLDDAMKHEIPAGDYTVFARGCQPSGKCNSEGTSFAFTLPQACMLV
jgi:hypothetical protein